MKKAWEEMTRSERKVAVAKDVRAHILAKSFKVTPGSYLNIYKDLDELPDSQSQAQCLLSSKKNKCEACARGAMMLVKVAKWNHWDGNFDFGVDAENNDDADVVNDGDADDDRDDDVDVDDDGNVDDGHDDVLVSPTNTADVDDEDCDLFPTLKNTL
jgi:hypothetical protein